MNLQVVHGDLLGQDVDVIVNAWNRNIIPWWLLLPQGVSGAIKRRGGTGPFKELCKHGSIPLGGAVLTSAGRLPFKGIIHVAGINMLWRASEWSIRQCVRSAMDLAHEKGFKSIAFPLIGAGSGGFNQDRAQAIMEDELGKMNVPMEVRLVVYEKPGKNLVDNASPEAKEVNVPSQDQTRETSSRWVVRQLARRLRYRTVDEVIGRTVALHSLETMLADIQVIVDDFCPGSVFRGPEQVYRVGALAKYGLLDLKYDAPPSMAATQPHRGLSLLKELGFILAPDDPDLAPFDRDAGLRYLAGLLKDMEKNENLLILFLEERPARPFPPPAEWEQWWKLPASMPFPKTMEITDACVTNLDSVWLNKHLYL
jgi:O-acetyl-ADP-ribose deacetylase